MTVKGGYLATIELRDLHAGRQVIDEREWSLETWSRVCRNSVIDTCDLLSRMGNFDMILLVTGDDLIHFDTDAMTTTGGTRVEGHSSIPRIIDCVCSFMVWAIEYIASLGSPISYLHICGNHDSHLGWLVSRWVQAYFRTTPGVTFDVERSTRKHLLWKQVLLVYEHGQYLTPARLSSIVPQLFLIEWGKSKYRQVTLGHWHKSKVVRPLIEYSDGIMVRYVPSLAPPDNYHMDRGWQGEESMSSFVYNDNSMIANFTVRARE